MGQSDEMMGGGDDCRRLGACSYFGSGQGINGGRERRWGGILVGMGRRLFVGEGYGHPLNLIGVWLSVLE